MADFFGDLQRALVDATARRYRSSSPAGSTPQPSPPRLAWLRRVWHRRPVAVVLAALVICSSAAAAVVALAQRNSAPLVGAVPGSRGLSTAGLHYDISVIPDLEPGDAGWCSYPRFQYPGGPQRTKRISQGGTCSPALSGNPPVILGGGGNSLYWAIVSSQVAGVRVGPHEVIRPRSDPRLPNGWRAAVTFSPALNPTTRPPADQSALPELIPLDAQGRPILMSTVRTLAQVPVRSVDPDHPPRGLCALHAPQLPGLTRQWEVVAAALPHFGSTVAADALFTCAHSWYLFAANTPVISAAVLLNARNPAKPAPNLPDLRPTTAPGVFTEDGGSAGDITARRVARAWLLVQGGSPQTRAKLLQNLAQQKG